VREANARSDSGTVKGTNVCFVLTKGTEDILKSIRRSEEWASHPDNVS
jgi:hypothetical protein